MNGIAIDSKILDQLNINIWNIIFYTIKFLIFFFTPCIKYGFNEQLTHGYIRNKTSSIKKS